MVQVLHGLPPQSHPNLIVGSNSGDDAAVYDLGDGRLLLQTLDFFTPVVDDPFTFGQIAASNAISDIYAMGGTPLFALNIVAFPLKQLGHDVLREILNGGASKAAEAGIPVAGGHSIDDAEPKYGMVVTGEAKRGEVLTNSGAKPGDVVILTKPLGVGIVTTGIKQGKLAESDATAAIQSMAALNRPGAVAARAVGAQAATDITGFGLLGHLGGIARESRVTIDLEFGGLPFVEHALELVKAGVAPGGTRKNLAFYGSTGGGSGIKCDWQGEWQEWQQLLVADAQTCGGMAICVPEGRVEEAIRVLEAEGALAASPIGRVTKFAGSQLVLKA